MDDDRVACVRRGGLLSALAYGFFGTISVIVICATAVAIIAMTIVSDRIDQFLSPSPDIVSAISEWQDALPPAIFDAIHDRRAPEYGRDVDVSVELVGDEHGRGRWPVVKVTNNGQKLISLLSLRVAVEDVAGVPIREMNTYAATPLAGQGEWRGPMPPESTRRIKIGHWPLNPQHVTAVVAISELRVWDEDSPAADVDIGSLRPATEPDLRSPPSIETQRAGDRPGGNKPAKLPGEADSSPADASALPGKEAPETDEQTDTPETPKADRSEPSSEDDSTADSTEDTGEPKAIRATTTSDDDDSPPSTVGFAAEGDSSEELPGGALEIDDAG